MAGLKNAKTMFTLKDTLCSVVGFDIMPVIH